MAGYILLFSLFFSIAFGFSWVSSIWPAAILAWLAAILMFFGLSAKISKVVAILFVVGCGVWALALGQGAAFVWQQAIGVNQQLIALLTGVHFLRLVALPKTESLETLPRGSSAFSRSWLGVHGLGAVINLSVVFLVADRLHRQQTLTPLAFILLIRAFASAAFWSPFFAAFAAALVYAPQASLGLVMAVGIPLALVGYGLSIIEFRRHAPVELEQFSGYPLHFNALFVPSLLFVIVFVGQGLLSQVPMILLIACSAWALTMGLLICRHGFFEGLQLMSAYVQQRLPDMSGELLLFLAAGLFGSGLAALFAVLPELSVLELFTGTTASLVLLGMVILAICGVHPVISIAMVGVWVMPLEVSHTLLAVMFLMAWAIGVCVSPFSGMNLALQGRYGINGSQLFHLNKGYALKMLVVSALFLHGLDAWLLRNP